MSEVYKLRDYGVQLWLGRLENHDFLWFATSDLNATATTWPILHNYALTYAIYQYSYAIYKGYRPKYDYDLDQMQAYALASYNPQAGRTRLTHNAIDEVTLRTDAVIGSTGKATPARFNTPKLGHRVCLTPVMQKVTSRNVDRARRGFDVFLFTWDGFCPPSVFRLGKKGCPMRVDWQLIEDTEARIPGNEFSPCHAVNPRDIMLSEQESVVSYYPAIIPPHLLYVEARLRGEWAVLLPGGRWVHVPRRIVGRWRPPLSSQT
jgi:CRISPR type I-D-associated protein Csc1